VEVRLSQCAKWQEPSNAFSPGTRLRFSSVVPKVAGLLVRNDRAGIVMRREVSAHDLVKRDSVRPAISMVPLNGFATAILGRLAARSSEKMG
jgi:hypothetical protein